MVSVAFKHISSPASAIVGDSSANVSTINVSTAGAPQSKNPGASSTVQVIVYSLPFATVASPTEKPEAIALGSFTSENVIVLGPVAVQKPC